MDQHPVPQNISSYEFRLIGDMTLKQFFQLSGGILAALLLWQLPLPFLVKAVLGVIAIFIGVALAFLPVGGRPFSQWLMAFFQAVYAPTKYEWRPSPVNTTDQQIKDEALVKPVIKNQLDNIEEQLMLRLSNFFSQSVVVPKKVAEITWNVTPQTSPSIPNPPQEQIVVVPDLPTTPTSQSIQAKTEPEPISASVSIPIAPVLANIPSPAQVNVLVGQIEDHQGQLVEGAIVEILDTKNGYPIRALRTNKLGQFQIVTPLPPGKFIVSVEKETLVFDRVFIEANNTIIQPILLKAHG